VTTEGSVTVEQTNEEELEARQSEGLSARDQQYQEEAAKVTEALEERKPQDIEALSETPRKEKNAPLEGQEQVYQQRADELREESGLEERAAGGVTASASSTSSSETAAFDPGNNNVGDVIAYVDAHPDQLDAVLAAEKAGQNRVTLVQQLETRR
jgi:hypothetical protein